MDCSSHSSFRTKHQTNPGRNNGRNFSGIRALTAVKISHRNRYSENMGFDGKQFEDFKQKKHF